MANNTVQLPVGALTLTGLVPTIRVSTDNTVRLPVGSLAVGSFAPSINAGQTKVTYKGRIGIKTTFRSTLGG